MSVNFILQRDDLLLLGETKAVKSFGFIFWNEGGFMPSQKNCLSLLVGILFCLNACGNSYGNNKAPDEQTGSPKGGPQPESWKSIFNERVTDMVSPDQCDFPFRFRIDSVGNFKAGPCTTGGSDFKLGELTSNERAKLDTLASAVADNDLRTNHCSQGTAIAGSVTALTLQDTRKFEILRDYPDKFCFRGDRSEADELHRYVNQLSQKYYPSR